MNVDKDQDSFYSNFPETEFSSSNTFEMPEQKEQEHVNASSHGAGQSKPPPPPEKGQAKHGKYCKPKKPKTPSAPAINPAINFPPKGDHYYCFNRFMCNKPAVNNLDQRCFDAFDHAELGVDFNGVKARFKAFYLEQHEIEFYN